MPIFMTLVRETPEGSKAIKALPDRVRAAREGLERAGGQVLGAYAVLGGCDFLFVTSLPDEKVALAGVLRSMQWGTASFETWTLIPMEETFNIIAAI